MANFAPLIGESLSHDHTDLIVGDVKQSIYRWRNSDWSLLNEGVQSLFRPSQYSERSMNMNYRSCACIVEFNNRIFGEAARLLQQKLEREIEESALVEGSFDVQDRKGLCRYRAESCRFESFAQRSCFCNDVGIG